MIDTLIDAVVNMCVMLVPLWFIWIRPYRKTLQKVRAETAGLMTEWQNLQARFDNLSTDIVDRMVGVTIIDDSGKRRPTPQSKAEPQRPEPPGLRFIRVGESGPTVPGSCTRSCLLRKRKMEIEKSRSLAATV